MKNFWRGAAAIFFLNASVGLSKHSGGVTVDPPDKDKQEAPAAACTFDDLTRECALFDPKMTGPRIKFPDGTFIPNYAYDAEFDAPEAERNALREKRSKASKDAHAKLAKLKKTTFQTLSEIPEAKRSLGFLLAFSNIDHQSNPIARIYRKWATKTATAEDGEEDLFLPWPPEDEDAKQEYVPAKTVWGKLDELLGEKGREKMATVVKEYDALRADIAEANLTDEQREGRTVKPDRAKRVEELFASAQKKLEKVFSRGRPESEWSAAEKRAIEKLRLVKMLPPTDENVRNDAMCRGAVPNAWYHSEGLTIAACPAFFNFPDATIMGILGHELGHAVDPCNAQCSVCSIDLAAKNKKPEPKKVDPKDAEERIPALDLIIPLSVDEAALEGALKNSTKAGGKHISVPFDLYYQKKTVDKLVEKGVLKTVVEGTPHGEYPLKDVYECLKTEKGGGFRAHSNEEVGKIAEAVIKNRRESAVGPLAFDPEIEKAKIKEKLSKYPECVSLKSHSHMGEALADWMGGNVLGDFLKEEREKKKKKLDTPADKLATIGYFASMVCAEHFRKPLDEDFKSFELTALRSEYEALNDPHPSSKNRIDKIFLRNATVLEELGCPPNPDACQHGAKKEDK